MTPLKTPKGAKHFRPDPFSDRALESGRLVLSLAATLPIVTIHVCHSGDGAMVGELSESAFRDKISSGDLRSEDFYWHEGMADWKPIAEYRTIAKTQKIAIAPPPSRPFEAGPIKTAVL